MSDKYSSKKIFKNLVPAVPPDKRSVFLVFQSIIFAASIFLPQLRTVDVITSPLGYVTLPVLTGTLTIVAVLFTWHGKVHVEHKGTKLRLENLPERDARKKYSKPWEPDDTE